MNNNTIIIEHRAQSTEHRAQSTEHRAQSQPVVSFCIPVYNNAEAALRIVKGILVSDDTRFEVIACDDASKDNAQELLSQIQDSRFRYIRNDKNLGAHRNWLKSLELGRGEWLYFVIGRDRINGEHITRLIELLEWARESEVTLLNDGCTKKAEPAVYSGIEAMNYFLGNWHPTGTIFMQSTFTAIPDKEYYFTHSDMYPENFIRRDMLLSGRGAFVMSGVYIYPSPLVDKVKVKSTVENGGNIYDMYYAPRRRTVHHYELIDMIDALEPGTFSTADRDKFFRKKFYSLLFAVSLNWLEFCKDFEWQSHYGQEVRRVGVSEMVRNIFTAYRATKAHLEEKGTMTPARQRIMRRCIVKFLMYELPFKNPARQILKPLGIWGLLQHLKRLLKSPA